MMLFLKGILGPGIFQDLGQLGGFFFWMKGKSLDLIPCGFNSFIHTQGRDYLLDPSFLVSWAEYNLLL